MFTNLRWRLTLWFVALATLVFAVLTSVILVRVHTQLTDALQREAYVLAAEIRPLINTSAELPDMPQWHETPGNDRHRLEATIQLFDKGGKFLEDYGPEASVQLFDGYHEYQWQGQSLLTLTQSLHKGGQLVGFLQIQLPTFVRDKALGQFTRNATLFGPLLLLGLGIAGYFFAGLAMVPVESSFALLRRFMADAGHELTTPLSVIQVNMDQLEHELSDNQNALQRLQVMERSTEKMGMLIKDLSFLSKMESPQLTFPLSEVRLDKCLKELSEEFSESYKAKNLTLKVGDLPPLTVFGYAEALRCMLSNLLQNAYRYSNADGQVTVSLTSQGQLAKVTVSDTGIGVKPANLPHIFERFYRGDQPQVKSIAGSGLGLSIVKAVAQAHRGSVEAQSELGRGTTFIVTLPLKR